MDLSNSRFWRQLAIGSPKLGEVGSHFFDFTFYALCSGVPTSFSTEFPTVTSAAGENLACKLPRSKGLRRDEISILKHFIAFL